MHFWLFFRDKDMQNSDPVKQSSFFEPNSLSIRHLFPNMLCSLKFVNVFVRASHWSVPWVLWIKCIPLYTVLNPFLILPSHLRLGFPNCFFPSHFTNVIPMRLSPCVLRSELMLSSMWSSQLCYFFLLALQPQFGPWATSMKLSVSLRFTRS
jgi:hypothetical protein